MSLGEIADFFLPKNEAAKQDQNAPVVMSQIPNEIRERRNKLAQKAQQANH